jgi:large subunit ribosomal protein L15
MAIRIHDLQPAPGAKKAKTRVGRGEGSKGKTAGRGTKGTKARKNVKAGFEGGQMPLQMRLPKLKGFKPHNRTVYQVVNLDRLVELFPEGGEVGPEQLVEHGVLNKNELVKVLGSGELEGVKFDLRAHAFSASATTKVTAAGGTTTVVDKKTGEALGE